MRTLQKDWKGESITSLCICADTTTPFGGCLKHVEQQNQWIKDQLNSYQRDLFIYKVRSSYKDTCRYLFYTLCASRTNSSQVQAWQVDILLSCHKSCHKSLLSWHLESRRCFSRITIDWLMQAVACIIRNNNPLGKTRLGPRHRLGF